MRWLAIVAVAGILIAQEVSQSGLELKGPRPMVSQPERAAKAMLLRATDRPTSMARAQYGDASRALLDVDHLYHLTFHSHVAASGHSETHDEAEGLQRRNDLGLGMAV